MKTKPSILQKGSEKVKQTKTTNKQTKTHYLITHHKVVVFLFVCFFVLDLLCFGFSFSYLMLGTVQTSFIIWWGCSKDSEKSACFCQTHILVLKKFAQDEIAFSDFERGLKLSSSFLLFQITTILSQHVNFRISI